MLGGGGIRPSESAHELRRMCLFKPRKKSAYLKSFFFSRYFLYISLQFAISISFTKSIITKANLESIKNFKENN